MHHTLRPATPADQPFLDALFLQVHHQDFALLGLDPANLHTLLQMQARAQRQGYAQAYPGAQDRIILHPDATPIGRILTDDQPNAIHLIDIALLLENQATGIGTSLLEGLIAEAQATGRTIQLTVNPGNRAFSLYTRLGFRKTGSNGPQLQLTYSPASLQPAPPPAAGVAGVDWLPLLNHTFYTEGIPLTLAHLRPGLSPASFSLTFHGPLQPILPQATYPLVTQPPQNHLPSHIFLVPVGAVPDAMQYEAVFHGHGPA